MRGHIHDLLRAWIALCTRSLGRLLALRHRWRIRRFSAQQAALHRRYGLGPGVPILRHGAQLQAQLEAHAGPGVAYAATSGSSGTPKRIPYTRGRVRMVKAVYMDAFARAYAALGIRRTSLYVFSSLKRDASLTALMMAESNELPPFLSTLQAPYRVHSHPAMEALAQRYGTAGVRLWVLAISRPGGLYATNPSTLSVFQDTLAQDWDGARAMVVDWVGGGEFAPAVHRIARRLTSQGSQARLQAIATAQTPMTLAQCIPGLELICCWDGGYVRPFLDRVLARLPSGVQHLPMYSMSTETVETVPHFGAGVAFLPLAPGVRCEFLGMGSQEAVDSLVQPESLEQESEYSLVVSDPHGLRRYHTEDVFRCVGHIRGVPDLRFQRRLGLSFSFTGEKLTADHVTAALAAVRAAHPPATEIPWMVCIPSQPAGDAVPHYRLALGLRTPLDLDEPALAATFDAALSRQNPEYADKRASGRLGPVVAATKDFQTLVARVGGQRHAQSWETQFKFLPMVARTWESMDS
jgi:hypothetical protein